MDFSDHLLISAAGAAAILGAGASPEGALAFGLMGVFIDLDHLADYWPQTGFNLDVPRFMSFFSSRQNQRMLLFLHAWEWCALLGLYLLMHPQAPSWLGFLLLSWFLHLCLDHYFNRLRPLTYFFSYRLRWRFRSDAMHRA